MKDKRITTASLIAKKKKGQKITVLTAYDYSTARLIDEAGIDVVLVGDSLGMVVLGYDSTIPVTMQDMLHHTKAVARGVKSAMILADLPFMSYQISTAQAMDNAALLLQEGGAHAVKLEGGRHVADTINRIVDAGIPVMGHLGMTPQSVHKFGGFKVQGKSQSDAERIITDAKALEEAGVFGIVLELIPMELARKVTESVSIPTIGIGAGPHCDGQVQVVNDILGLYGEFQPKHAKKYANLSTEIKSAFRSYADDVRSGSFPSEENSF